MTDEVTSTSTSTESRENERTPLLISDINYEITAIVHKKRWLMLVIFVLNAVLSGNLLGGLTHISNIVATYYDVSPVAVEWTSLIFLLVSTALSIPAAYVVSKIGSRKSLTIVAVLNATSTIFHVISFRQVPAALAYCFLFPLAPRLSADWFPMRERASSTSFCVFSGMFGYACASAIVTNIVNSYDIHSELKTVFIFHMVFAIVVAVITGIVYREKPGAPRRRFNPANVAEENELSFLNQLKMLLVDRNFFFMSQSYGIYFGLSTTLIFLVNPLLAAKFPNGHVSIIGWLGFAFIIISYLSTLMSGLWLDRYQSFRGISIMFNVCSFATWLLFTLLFIETANFFTLFGVYVILGLIAVPYIYIGPEHAAEITYPVRETTSTAFIFAIGNFYSFVLLLSVDAMTSKGYLKSCCLTIMTLFILSSAFSIMSNGQHRRQNATTGRD